MKVNYAAKGLIRKHTHILATVMKDTHKHLCMHAHTESLTSDISTSAEAENFSASLVRLNYTSFSLVEKFNLLHQKMLN
jgi:hypothetical protein